MATADTLFHEAGHAVAAFILTWPVRHVSAVPDETSAGRCSLDLRIPLATSFSLTAAGLEPHGPGTTQATRDRDLAEAKILFGVAGCVAEALHLARYRPGLDVRAHALARLESEIVEGRGDWPHVTRQLDAIDGDDAPAREATLGRILALAIELLGMPRHWEAIRAIARALAFWQSISGEDALHHYFAAVGYEAAPEPMPVFHLSEVPTSAPGDRPELVAAAAARMTPGEEKGPTDHE